METTMYDVLLQLPLFQGLGKNEFTDILTKVRFHFSKYRDGDCFIKQGDPCNKLVFLLSGNVMAETCFEKEKVTFGEVFAAPYLLEPFSIYGLNATFRSTYIAKGETAIITIDKEYITMDLNNYETFRINFVNILSQSAQVFFDKRGDVPAGCAGKRIIEYLENLSILQKGEKTLRTKMEDLAVVLGATRLRISQALNDMSDKGLLIMQRKEFHIPDLQALVAYKETLVSEDE